MILLLSIGGVRFRVESTPGVLEALASRYGSFVVSDGGDAGGITVDMEVRARHAFEPRLEMIGSCEVRADPLLGVLFTGAVCGRFNLDQRRGVLEDATGLGAVDAILRAALSLVLPLDGGLLLHAAAIETAEGAIVLCGDSGAGKSTAARALGAICDEIVIVRPSPRGLQVFGTPYWRGRPLCAPCRQLVCLIRGGASLRVLDGVRAARVLMRHVIRYVSIERVERAILPLIARACGSKMIEARCPEGEDFIPFLSESLNLERTT
jgi:hypothetical protein